MKKRKEVSRRRIKAKAVLGKPISLRDIIRTKLDKHYIWYPIDDCSHFYCIKRKIEPIEQNDSILEKALTIIKAPVGKSLPNVVDCPKFEDLVAIHRMLIECDMGISKFLYK